MTAIVGIDLGTTHSLVGVYDVDGPRLLPNALGDMLTPSVVSVDPDGRVLVGQAARERLITAPGNTVTAFKRWMGTDRVVRLGVRDFRPEELSALVLKSLMADAESALGRQVTEAVISVPAYFGDAQRKATRIAGELAGITVERLINEPTAAALAYGLQERPEGGRFLVFDLGGGTFDVSILEMFDGVMEVHASAGDNFLGGEDFLHAIVSACLQELGQAGAGRARAVAAVAGRLQAPRLRPTQPGARRGTDFTGPRPQMVARRSAFCPDLRASHATLARAAGAGDARRQTHATAVGRNRAGWRCFADAADRAPGLAHVWPPAVAPRQSGPGHRARRGGRRRHEGARRKTRRNHSD